MRPRLVARMLATGLLLAGFLLCATFQGFAQQLQAPNSQRGAESEVDSKPAMTAQLSGPYVALVIGINDYEHLPRLKTAVGDAEEIEKILRNTYGFQTHLLLNATRNQITSALFEYRTSLDKNSNLVIYYAGHGHNDEQAGETYWLPVDARDDDNSEWIQSHDITADLRAIPARHILVVSDSCYSGSMREISPVSTRLLVRLMQGKSRTLMSSGKDEPVSDEGTGGHSAFAGPLIDALKAENAEAFSARGLFDRIQGIVAGNSAQTPNYARLSNSGDDGSSEFVFIRHAGSPPGIATVEKLAKEYVAGSSEPISGIYSEAILTVSANVRPSAAVLAFKNLGQPESNSLSVAISEILSTELAASGSVRTISMEEVARATEELALPDADAFAKDTLARIRKRIDADAVFVGSYRERSGAEGGQIVLDLCAQNTNTGFTVCVPPKTGRVDNLAEVVVNAGDELVQKLGLSEITPTVEAEVRAAFPSNPGAMRLYAEGLKKLRLFDYVGAREDLEGAAAAAPNVALIHSALAEALSSLGYDDRAKEAAKKAFELSDSLPREEQLLIEGRYRELNSGWEDAVRIYSSLWIFFNDNPDYGIKLAGAQTLAEKGQDALATVEALRKLPAPASVDPRIDIEEANAAKSLSDFTQELHADAQASKIAEAQGASFLMAQALMDECWALYKLGGMEKASKACEDAITTFGYVGDKKDVARTATRQADILMDQGNVDAALIRHKQALQYMREIGSQRDIAGALVNVADVMLKRGDLDGARKNYEEALEINRKANDRKHLLECENDVASVFYFKGDFAEAMHKYEEVVVAAQQIHDKDGEAEGLSNIGLMLYLQGQLREAQNKIQAALDISRRLGTKSGIGASDHMLGDVLLAQGDLASAERNYEESRKIFVQTGEKGELASSEISLAGLSLEQGSVSKADSLARLAEKEFHAENDVDDEASGLNMLARALIAQNKFSEANAAIQDAQKLPMHDVTVQLSLKITASRLQGKAGTKIEALRNLDDVVKNAKSMKLTGYEFEARLAKAEIQLQESRSRQIISDLKELEEQANAKGYRLIGRKAAVLLGRTRG